MSILDYLAEYKELHEYFNPEYERENKVLNTIQARFPIISQNDTLLLKNILEQATEWPDKFFVADLLYLYQPIDEILLEPMLNCAIQFQDPSFNRIFLHPCVKSFGMLSVCEILTKEFLKGDIVVKINIANLLYWIRPQKEGQADKIFNTVLKQAALTDNLVEIYHYALRFGKNIRPGLIIPGHAEELTNAIKGNADYESLLYDKLGWRRS